MLGATTEFEKEEGITFSSKHNKVSMNAHSLKGPYPSSFAQPVTAALPNVMRTPAVCCRRIARTLPPNRLSTCSSACLTACPDLQLFIAYTKISNGMADDKKYSAGQAGDVNMPPNACGAIFTLDLDASSTAVNAKVSG
jgi:hypothetical protein